MIPLIGYADAMSAAPGGLIRFMVSSTAAEPFEAKLVRLVLADPNPHGPGYREDEVASPADGRYPSRFQPTWLGSHGTAALPLRSGSFALEIVCWPTLPGRGRQGVLTQWDCERGAGFALLLDEAGGAAFEVGDGQGGLARAATGRPLLARTWYRLRAGWDAAAGTAWVEQAPLKAVPQIADAGRAETPAAAFAPADRPLLVAALDVRGGEGQQRAGAHYNGKLERPRVLDGAGAVLAEWDFAREMSGQEMRDVGPHTRHGRFVNLPARAMTGADWTGAEMRWTRAPEQYGAVHFHEDDLYDCGWQADVELRVPADLPCGCYAMRLRCAGNEDHIPFYVRAPLGRPRAEVVFLAPTFTYQAYCNFVAITFDERDKQRAREWGAWTWFTGDHPDYGRSTYDKHTDGSGICYTSRLRPNLNLRPRFLANADRRGSGMRHLPADTYLTNWLEHIGQPYDVVTDEDLHREGVELLRPYRVVLTGSHPEYHTPETVGALQRYVDGGGRLMYLGGNGFYWKIAQQDGLPGVYELRRAESGIRLWAAEPGEYYHSFDGSYGGLWRRNGRPPNRLTGVGFTSQGSFDGSYYRRQPASFDPRAAFVFEGIGEGELIGDFGFFGGGAAGFELDRADPTLGTPPNALILATSEGHPEQSFRLVNEEMLRHLLHRPVAEVIRSDMVFFETACGGAVFSVGSITYIGSLPYNGFANNVARLTGNVLRRFLDPAPF